VLESNPTNKITLCNAGEVCKAIALVGVGKGRKDFLAHPVAQRAQEYFEHDVRVDPNSTYTLYQYATFFGACKDQVNKVISPLQFQMNDCSQFLMQTPD